MAARAYASLTPEDRLTDVLVSTLRAAGTQAVPGHPDPNHLQGLAQAALLLLERLISGPRVDCAALQATVLELGLGWNPTTCTSSESPDVVGTLLCGPRIVEGVRTVMAQALHAVLCAVLGHQVHVCRVHRCQSIGKV